MSGEMDIAFVIDEIHGATAGTEKQLLQLIPRLSREQFRCHLVVLRSSEFLQKGWDSCEVHSLDLYLPLTLGGAGAVMRLRKVLTKNKVLMVQTFFRDANVIGLLAAFLARVPLRLSSRRNLRYETTRADRLVYDWMDPLIHYYMVNGEAVKRHLVQNESIAPGRIRVFHNLLDLDIESMANLPRARTSSNHVVFLLVANLRPVKGHRFLLEAVRGVQQRIRNARFLLVGSGPRGEAPEATDVFKAVVESGLSDRFEFVGMHHDIRPFLSKAHVGLLCSSSEGFSSSLLEYVAMGLPCIATDVGSNGELVVDGFNGIVVQHGDVDALGRALVLLYENETLRREMGERSRRHFQSHFLPANQLRQLEGFYREEIRNRMKQKA